jgi:hypothetical protein
MNAALELADHGHQVSWPNRPDIWAVLRGPSARRWKAMMSRPI